MGTCSYLHKSCNPLALSASLIAAVIAVVMVRWRSSSEIAQWVKTGCTRGMSSIIQNSRNRQSIPGLKIADCFFCIFPNTPISAGSLSMFKAFFRCPSWDHHEFCTSGLYEIFVVIRSTGEGATT